MRRLNFSYHWNNKLSCNYFTTIRIWNERKYVIGESYEVYLKDNRLGTATLEEGHKFTLEELPSITACLDTGYSKQETIGIMTRMYPTHTGYFGLYLFKNNKSCARLGVSEQDVTGMDSILATHRDVEGATRRSSPLPDEVLIRYFSTTTDKLDYIHLGYFVARKYMGEDIVAFLKLDRQKQPKVFKKLDMRFREEARKLNPLLVPDDMAQVSLGLKMWLEEAGEFSLLDRYQVFHGLIAA